MLDSDDCAIRIQAGDNVSLYLYGRRYVERGVVGMYACMHACMHIRVTYFLVNQ
jgi:hypothetical protein